MRKNIISLFQVLGPWRWRYFSAAGLLVLSMGLRMLEPKVFQVAIDKVVELKSQLVESAQADWVAKQLGALLALFNPNSVLKIFLLMGFIYFVLALLRAVTSFGAITTSSDATEKAIRRLRNRIFDKIQRLPMVWHSRHPKGEMIQRCTGDIDTVRRFILNDVVEVFRLLAIFSFAFAMMWIVHWKYALLAVSLVPVIGVVSFLFFKREAKIWQEHEDEQDKLTGIIEENLAGIRVVKAFAKEQDQIESFDKQNQVKLDIGKRHTMLHALYWPFSDFLLFLQFASCVFYGGYLTLHGTISLGELTSFYVYSWMVAWPMREVGRIMSRMGMASVAMERINSIMHQKEEVYAGKKPSKALQGNIEFRNVSFAYEKENWVLNDISFKVKAGEKVAFIGPTGSGKSSIVALLNRFFEPQKGEIFLDGWNIKELDKLWLRSQIGTVLQKAFLFSISLKDNIAYALQDPEEEKIRQSAKVAGIENIIEVFHDGYETLVGEKGVSLSGGQKQRLALARTLITDCEILVLDDTTSAVDTETEFEIQNALNERLKGKTQIIISHRLSALQNLDRVFVLDKANLVQQGTVEELSAQEGYFLEILKVQSDLEENIVKEIKDASPTR